MDPPVPVTARVERWVEEHVESAQIGIIGVLFYARTPAIVTSKQAQYGQVLGTRPRLKHREPSFWES
eukprot:3800601-Pyramimonas_sp.AAC.1